MGFTGSNLGALNPWTFGSYAGYYAIHNLYPQLVGLDRKGRLVGDLAESWKVSKSQKEWTFTLRRGGWSDGKPITARDVVFTINTAIKHSTGRFAGTNQAIFTSEIATARRVDAQTVVLRLKKPVYTFPSSLLEVLIVPQHIWGVGGATVDSLSQLGTKAPVVGGGPYSVTRLGNTSAVFKHNPNWIHGKVATPGLGIRNYGSDDALVLGLRSNEIDIAPAFFGSLPQGSLPSSVKRILGPNLAALGIWVNFADSAHPELRSPRVRKALSLAIDRNQLANLAFTGAAVPESSVVFTAAKPWHHESLKPDPYSPRAANALLDDLGFARGSDGIRVANGRRMSYEALENTGGVNAQARTLVVQYMKAIGIEIREKIVDSATVLALQNQHDWTLYFSVFFGGTDGLVWLANLKSPPATSAFDTGYRSVKFNQLYAQLERPGITAAQAKQVIDQLQILAASARPFIMMNSLRTVALARKNVSGVYAWIFGGPNPRDLASWGKIRVGR